MIYQHNDTTCHGSWCLGELFSCEILSLKVLSRSIFDLQVQHWSEGSQTQRRHTSSSQRLQLKSCNDVCSLPMELVEAPSPPPPPDAFMPRVANWTITYSTPSPPSLPDFCCCCCCRTSTTVNTPSYIYTVLYCYTYRHQNLSFCFWERERMTLQQFSFEDLWPELKCGHCEHYLKCQNNHQHNCGHSISRKEEEE